ncbi:hypothetical protein KR215_002100 [Drosophila sulfurigaster]|uniref:uncharacterized protein LOC133848481 n=1 Tax=Drosophila sulfurigaster albostrigata TaxID=89887 RepID=UPI002D21C3B8|nr:uncharacterized protein LOC133848481 [Drosophila sulfurigaster albostrigata]XP_062140061.1 uncharacterized protein LOC133848481 [Drosophila sulfurigaster albostrigata]KAH8394329.1 hypothetical protein KR215_002100 [Drosophila sulfurigaster]
MSVLAYPRTNDEEIFRQCTKDCGVVTATEDFQYFALRCIFCSEKFLYFDAFIGHMQTVHLEDAAHRSNSSSGYRLGLGLGLGLGQPMSIGLDDADGDGDDDDDGSGLGGRHGYGNGSSLLQQFDEIEDLTDADTALLEPQMVIKQELQELDSSDNDNDHDNDNENDDDAVNDDNLLPADDTDNVDDDSEAILPESDLSRANIRSRMKLAGPPPYLGRHGSGSNVVDVKNEPLTADGDDSMDEYDHNYLNDNSNEYPDYNPSSYNAGHGNNSAAGGESDFLSYDEMVEESLLGRDRELTMHIKDRKMIQFLIHSYKRNPFLWDHSHAQFRDRVKRARFLDWIVLEFKNRFNISLAKDAITRKWDNLRTVYKRECNRMALEKTNISTLWYFKELHFLNELYSYNSKMSDAVVKETSYRRRFSAIWNDTSTAKLLVMVKRYQCFYNRFDPDYRSKERRGEGLQQMAMELQQLIDVTTIQISKRISQLRFDYSKQKMERLNAERMGRKFIPNYIYYDQMHFMDDDIPPFKCEHCGEIVQTLRELDLHMLSHQPSLGGSYYCNVCNIQFNTGEEFENHKQLHLGAGNEVKYNCELCTASFREKSNYDEHLRRHNDELFLPTLALNHSILDSGSGDTDAAGGGATDVSLVGDDDELFVGDGSKPFPCEVCHRTFASPGHLNAHRVVHQDERERCYKCDYPQCSKSFVSRHSLFDHLKQHYSNEEFKCDICGKSFKSTKNLQNHKQIHDKVKRYVCQICGSAFAQAAGLYLHKRRHNRPNGSTGAVGGRSSRTTL